MFVFVCATLAPTPITGCRTLLLLWGPCNPSSALTSRVSNFSHNTPGLTQTSITFSRLSGLRLLFPWSLASAASLPGTITYLLLLSHCVVDCLAVDTLELDGVLMAHFDCNRAIPKALGCGLRFLIDLRIRIHFTAFERGQMRCLPWILRISHEIANIFYRVRDFITAKL